MSEQLTKQNIKGILIQYVFEIIVIFLGISISFWFDEWRDNRKDIEMERKHLSDLRDNLQQDTFIFSHVINNAKRLISSSRKLATFKNEAEILDSINFHIDNASSYLGLQINQTAYEEIKQTGHTSLISNDSLKKAILSHYTITIPGCIEWSNVDKNYTMSQILPEMSNYFPVVANEGSEVSSSQKVKALKIQKLRNLLTNSTAFKEAALFYFEHSKNNSKKLIHRIDKALKK